MSTRPRILFALLLPGLLVGRADAQPHADETTRPAIAANHLADYDSEPRRPDGRVDVDALTAKLKDLGANCYYWLIWHAKTDWDDLKLFLPKAREAGIDVWAYLVPPSESAPRYGTKYAEPFRLDYPRWAEEIAKLSLEHPNLTAWVIDDFYANRDLFTPEYVRGLRERSRAVNPRLAFLPLMYFPEMTEAFVADYRDAIDGVVVAYLRDREEVESVWRLCNDAGVKPSAEFVFPGDTPSKPGDFVRASLSAAVLPAERRTIRLDERDDFPGPTAGYHFKQLLIDDAVVWEEDVAGGPTTWESVEIDVTAQTRGKDRVALALRLVDKKGVSNFGVRWSVRDVRVEGLKPAADPADASRWTVARQGPFETGFGRPATVGRRRFHVPFLSMVAAIPSEFRQRHGDPAPARMAARLRLSLEARRDGLCDGVVTYCLDKSPESAIFPLARDLFHEFKDR